VLDDAQLAIFGPVVSEVPDDDEARELWQHVSWLVRHDSFSELKRDRPRRPAFRAAKSEPTSRSAA
jgi:hypothetical protein